MENILNKIGNANVEKQLIMAWYIACIVGITMLLFAELYYGESLDIRKALGFLFVFYNVYQVHVSYSKM